MPTTVNELSEILQKLFTEDADRLGKETGFIQRERKLKGSSFAQTLVFGWRANPHASLEGLCQSACNIGVRISPQGLQQRLTEGAGQFLQALVEQSLTYVVEGEGGHLEGLAQFEGVYLQDSTVIHLPEALASLWRGCGNQSGRSASLKVQTVFEYKQGRLQMSFHPGAAHECPLQQTDLPPNTLRLADSAYFKVAVFEQLNQQEVAWVSRVPARVGVWQDNRVVSLAHWLQQHTETCLDVSVHLTAQRFPCRLLAQRVPEAVAQQRRERAQREARRQTLPPETLALCEWTVMATNLPPERLSFPLALALLRLRWQIELLFKLWKQVDFSTSCTSRPQQRLCEVFAKLLGIVVQHWLLLVGCWGETQRSLFKAAQVLQKHAFHLAAVLTSSEQLTLALHHILHTLTRCKVQKRKARPATFQLLGRTFT